MPQFSQSISKKYLPYFFFVLLICGSKAAYSQSNLSFSKDVRPILGKCLHCHGTDENTRGGDLRLDTLSGATKDLGGYQAIVPGKSDESEIINRIHSMDADLQMPPADSGKTLSIKEKGILTRWVKEGAKYEKHWAFQTPRQPVVPKVENKTAVRNPIDSFVISKLEKENLSPAPRATKETLIRRVYLDLIGLPPTIEQIQSFLNDKSENAYEKVVDELLASPHYGERWGRLWLDLARYADTNGYEKDRPRTMWPYRDWVIKALNDDMPFDQFTIEQIAGDLIPNATIDQKIATGFHRNTQLNEEGGVEVEEFRFESVVDRVSTTGTVWLGMTIGCAQCHTHKYDPITHTEYYQLMAFLNNCDEPNIKLENSVIEQKRNAHKAKILKKEKELANNWPKVKSSDKSLEKRFENWKSKTTTKSNYWTPVRPTSVTSERGTTFTIQDDLSLLAGGNNPNKDVYTIEFKSNLKKITAIRIEALPDEQLPGNGPGRSAFTVNNRLLIGDFLLSEVELFKGDSKRKITKVEFAKPTASYSHVKCEPEKTIDGEFDTGWGIGTKHGQPHHIVLPLNEPLVLNSDESLTLKLHQIYIHYMVLGKFRISLTSDEGPIESSGVQAEVEDFLLVQNSELNEEQEWMLKREFLLTAPELKKQHEELQKLHDETPQHETAMVMQERTPDVSRSTHLRDRGEFRKPKKLVTPGTPDVLHPLQSDMPRNRMLLAKWLVDPQNPLVARVTVNRYWQAFFGRGIVKTSDDFGTQSSPPSNPKLLDWLATEFIRQGWSQKTMHKLIAMSATYQQDSNLNDQLLERDPNNILLARGPRIRVNAEMVRDIALTASGLLNREIGGPSVFPPQPAGITSISFGKFQWKEDTDKNRYRRGIYTYLKRTSPYAMFNTFDAPSGETCIVKRGRSNTPLQALTLLNDRVFLEAAIHLARQEISNFPNDNDQKIQNIYQRFFSRRADDKEKETVLLFYLAQKKRFESGDLDAKKLLESELNQTKQQNLDLNEWAAWTTVIRAVLNFDEAITKG